MLMLEKGKIGILELKNRIIYAPMGYGLDGYGKEARAYFAERAKGGAAMLCTHYSVFAEGEYGSTTEEEHEDMMKMAEVIHENGAKACIQVVFGIGRVKRFIIPQLYGDPTPCFCASPVPEFGFEDKICRAPSTEEMKMHLERLKKAAKFIAKSGFDVVEFHAYGGYYMDSFLTKKWNQRTDEFGGDLKGRAKFLLDTIAIFKEECGNDFPMIVKYSPAHFVDEEGYRTIDEGIELAKLFEQAGVHMLHLDPGCYECWERMMPPIYQQEQVSDLYVAQKIKEAVKIPVAANGKLGYPERGEAALRQGKADFLMVGRTMIADPELPNKIAEGCPDEIKPCIGCNEGCICKVTFGCSSISCAVNASAGFELIRSLPKVEKPKKVLVIGGGPAGLAAAIDAKTVGHDVELWEKTTRLGGLLNAAGRPSFKKEVADLLNYYRIQFLKKGIKVLYSKEATAEDILASGADEVILATGSNPIVPASISGIGGSNVVTAIDALNDVATLGKKLVIIGSGLVGCETALHLTNFGKKIDIIEMQPEILPENIFYQNKKMLTNIVNSNDNITVHTGSKLVRIERDCAVAEKNGKEIRLPCDTVVLAMGLKSNNELLGQLKGKIPVVCIGDSIKPRRILEATAEAREAVLSLSGGSIL